MPDERVRKKRAEAYALTVTEIARMDRDRKAVLEVSKPGYGGGCLKVLGSAFLFSGNAIGLGWHEAPPAGMIGGSMAETLHGLGGLSQVVLVGGGLLVAYAAAVVAAAEPKAKRG